MRYQVTCGDLSDVVTADNEADAWAAFCDKHEDVRKKPRRYQRFVGVLPEPEPELEVEVIDTILDAVVLEPEADETTDGNAN